MKDKDIKEILDKNYHLKHYSFKKNKTIRVMRPYYYRPTGTPIESLKEEVLKSFPTAKIVDSGDYFTAFKGGAPVIKQSHLYVEFKLPKQ